MDYNKLMEELDKEVSRPAMESVSSSKGQTKKAFEGYDAFEAELAREIGVEAPAKEAVEEDEEGLVFEEEPAGEVPGETPAEEEPSPEEIFGDAVKALYQTYVDAGEETPGAKVRGKVEDILNELEPESVEEPEEGAPEEEPAEEGVEGAKPATEAKVGGSIVERLKALGGVSSATESCKPKHKFARKMKAAKESQEEKPLDQQAALEAMGEERLSKAIGRYTELARGNKGTGSIYSVTESMGEKQINLNDHCLGRACVEYGYTRPKLKKAIVEAIQKGVI